MDCVVIKPFIGNGESFQRNQLIDASVFRNADALLSQRYLRLASNDEIASAYEDTPHQAAAGEVEAAPEPVTKKKKLTLKRRRA